VPYLPKTTNTTPPFTINRFLCTIQRLYLALEPGCQFIVDELLQLAIWENRSRSLGFCLVGFITRGNIDTLTTTPLELLGVVGE
jgi:hypothetical protein